MKTIQLEVLDHYLFLTVETGSPGENRLGGLRTGGNIDELARAFAVFARTDKSVAAFLEAAVDYYNNLAPGGSWYATKLGKWDNDR